MPASEIFYATQYCRSDLTTYLLVDEPNLLKFVVELGEDLDPFLVGLRKPPHVPETVHQHNL